MLWIFSLSSHGKEGKKGQSQGVWRRRTKITLHFLTSIDSLNAGVYGCVCPSVCVFLTGRDHRRASDSLKSELQEAMSHLVCMCGAELPSPQKTSNKCGRKCLSPNAEDWLESWHVPKASGPRNCLSQKLKCVGSSNVNIPCPLLFFSQKLSRAGHQAPRTRVEWNLS